MPIPPLITTTGLVLNNMMPGEGALGNYTPKGTASSEGISLMLRGIVRAAIATGDTTKTAFAKFLFDGACEHFFKGVRPTADVAQKWHHSWICNGGASFPVRGPLDPSGDLALSGYLYKRNPESSVVFTNGVGQLTPPPDVVYQVVSNNATFVWGNVFSALNTGSVLQVDYYIDSKGNKVFGSQNIGSFGSPSLKPSEHTDGSPGKIVLKTAVSGTLGVNYCVTVPEAIVGYGELYEAWPMWRKLATEEVSTAGDAIHWFIDAFALGVELEPSNPDWKNALDRMLYIWELTCTQESSSNFMFKGGANGPYNNFPLTYAYGYGKNNVDDDTSNWEGIPPTTRFDVSRTVDGYVTFDLPEDYSEKTTGGSIRYGVAFENKPLFLSYTTDSTVSMDIRSSITQPMTVTITDNAGVSYSSLALAGPITPVQSIAMSSFKLFQEVDGDSLGERLGDWSNIDLPPDVDNYVPPIYSAVSFPGRRTALVGDSITWMNTFHNPAVGDPSPYTSDVFGVGGGSGGQTAANGRYQYYGAGMCGYFVYANQILGQRLTLEPALQDRQAAEAADSPAYVGRYKNGNNFAIAGSRTINWELPSDNTLNDGKLEVGPVYNARRYITEYDVVVMLGGTNDLAGAATSAQTVFANLRKFAYEFAAAGKWVFVQTIMPRTVERLGGYYSPAGAGWIGSPDKIDPEAAYTREKQELVRDRILEVNALLRAEFGGVGAARKANIWFVDSYADLVGPNGRDPFGHVSHATDPLAKATKGNWKPGNTGMIGFYDGLHPGPSGAYYAGKKLAEVMIAAGVPASTSLPSLPFTVGSNLLVNPTFTRTTTRPATANGKTNVLGRAIGLGPALTDATHAIATDANPTMAARCNVGLGYQHGQVPDYWQFYRSQNTFANPVEAEGWTNFNEYTWSALSTLYPNLINYTDDSTWADGAVVTEITTHGGSPALKLTVNIPVTGNKSEAFVLRTLVPHGQHGSWDDYGWAVFSGWNWANGSPPQDLVTTVTNTMYGPGDYLFSKATLAMSGVSNMYTWRMSLNFLSIDFSAVSTGDTSTTGAIISSLAHSQNFWTPDLITEIGMVASPDELVVQSPIVKAPITDPLQNQYFAQYNFEFAFDCSVSPGTAVIYIKNPGVFKVTGV